jgi:hypothetical protein
MIRIIQLVGPLMIRRSLISFCVALLPAMAAALPNPAGQSTITMPTSGVVCDSSNQLCYDRNGLSLPLTGRYFGQYAERTAQKNFGGRLPLRRFELSNGVFCHTDQASCWRQENGQRVRAGRISEQLFGYQPQPTPQPTPFPSPYPRPVPSPIGNTGMCQLIRGNQLLFNGACALSEIRQGYQPRFEVRLRQGATYVFEQSNRGYVITDGSGGRWPVLIEDRGSRGIFSWADMRLDVIQRNYMPESTGKFQRAVNNFLIDLFN